GHNNVYGGENGNYNIVNNYYKYGPDTKKSVRSRIVNPTKSSNESDPFGSFFVRGNYVDGAGDVTRNNGLGIQMDKGLTEADKKRAVADSAFAVADIPAQSAVDAYQQVLQYAGAILPQRDTLDARIIHNVTERTGGLIDVQGGYAHGTAYEATTGAWPFLETGNPPADSDQDGMPDNWEKSQGLNPH